MITRAKTAWERLFEIRKKIDLSQTEASSSMKEIFNRIHFADIESERHNTLNKGTLYYKEYSDEEAEFFGDVSLSYTLVPNALGLIYATVEQFTNKKGDKQTRFKYASMNGYVRFIGDLVCGKVIYYKGLDLFLRITGTQYDEITENNFINLYPVDKRYYIHDFYQSIHALFKEKHVVFKYDATVYPYKIAGNNWVYDCHTLTMEQRDIEPYEHFNLYFDVNYQDINTDIPSEFFSKIANDEYSQHNIRLLHAYTLYRRMGLVPAEKFFILKDAGRTGKGLTVETVKPLFRYKQINFDALTGGGFESNNEWINFIDVELAHANETGAIGKKEMRALRKIASSETVIGRSIGENAVSIALKAVLVLDTNEPIDIGDLNANQTRAVKIAFKDRPKEETDKERHAFFRPYWQFIKPLGAVLMSASVSFLIASLEYLKEQDKVFTFHDATLKNYFSVDELTETQKIMLLTIGTQGFILSGDETLQQLIKEDYISLRYTKAQADMRAIGVKLNKPKKLDGKTTRVHIIGNEGLFWEAYQLVTEEAVL